MVKAVIFDIFDTLIIEKASTKYTSTLCAADLGIEHAQFQRIWEGFYQQMDIGAADYRQVLSCICKQLGVSVTKERLDQCEEKRIWGKDQNFADIDPRITAMLAELKSAGYRIALCSNCSAVDVHGFSSSALAEYVDCVAFSYQVGFAKPDREIYLHCANLLSVSPSKCVYVGDGGRRELYGAEAAGFRPVRAEWFLDTSSPKYSPMPFPSVSSPDALLDFIRA